MKDCKLVDKRLSTTSLDLIFTRCLPAKGAKKILLDGFYAALTEAAKQKRVPLDQFLAVVASASPSNSGTTAAESRFYDDKSNWTGVATRGGPTNIDNNRQGLNNLLDRSQDFDVRGVKVDAYEGPDPTTMQAMATAGPNETTPQKQRRLSARGLEMLLNGMSVGDEEGGGGGGDSGGRGAGQLSAAAQGVFGSAAAQVESPYRQVLFEYFQKHNPSKVR